MEGYLRHLFREEALNHMTWSQQKVGKEQIIEMTGKMLNCTAIVLSISALTPKLCVLLRSPTRNRIHPLHWQFSLFVWDLSPTPQVILKHTLPHLQWSLRKKP